MSSNCSLRRFTRLGRRQPGITLDPEWVGDAEAGDDVGVDLLPGAVVINVHNPENADLTVPLQMRSGTPCICIQQEAREALELDGEDDLGEHLWSLIDDKVTRVSRDLQELQRAAP